jgi:hypothetical protein
MHGVTHEMGTPARICSLREWIQKTIKSNIVNNAYNFIVLAGIYYILAGTGTTNHLMMTNIGFLFLYIPYAMIMVPTDAMRSSCNAFFKNKWIIKDGDPVGSCAPLKSTWRAITPLGLGFGAAATLAGSIMLIPIGSSPWSMYISLTYAFVVCFLLSNILLKRQLGTHLAAFIAEQSRSSTETSNTNAFWPYFTRQYVIPWEIIMVYVNIIICCKAYIEVSLSPGNMGQIPASTLLAFDTVLWVFLALGWMGSVSMSQGPLDFSLHRVMQERRALPLAKHKRDAVIVLILLIAMPLAATGITAMILLFTGITSFPVPVYITLCLGVFASFGIPGLYLGMLFGIAFERLDNDKRKKRLGANT